jgi:DNA-binding transcriptional LysR family regulator
VLAALLRNRSLTRAAALMDTSQPALSKALAKLRRYFDDPLFVRVALRMDPTRALELEAPGSACGSSSSNARELHARLQSGEVASRSLYWMRALTAGGSGSCSCVTAGT